MHKKKIFILSFLFFYPFIHAVSSHAYQPKKNKSFSYFHNTCNWHTKNYFFSLIHDIWLLNKNLFTADSFFLLAAFSPLYSGFRMVDDRIHANFYCAQHHKNICQMPSCCDYAARYGLAIPIVGLGSLAFLSSDEELRMTSWAFILGLPFLVFGNKITKKVQFEACYRPWHEQFSCTKRSPGGFPSGHAAYVAYMTMLYGLRYGPKWAIPLALYSTFVSINFCVCNRHYASQVVAGIGLGIMYALAADRFVDQKLTEDMSLYCSVNAHGLPAVGVSYSF